SPFLLSSHHRAAAKMKFSFASPGTEAAIALCTTPRFGRGPYTCSRSLAWLLLGAITIGAWRKPPAILCCSQCHDGGNGSVRIARDHVMGHECDVTSRGLSRFRPNACDGRLRCTTSTE